MVEDEITDGKRIAQLLASELEGLQEGPLASVSVDDADPDARPQADGTVAYNITFESNNVATVTIYPEAAAITLTRDWHWPAAEGVENTDEETLHVTTGAAVKDAVDAIRAILSQDHG
jgi:hypothetical protein